MTKDQTVFTCVLACTLVVVLTPHLFPRELTKPLPALPEMGPGCITDMFTGTMDCMYVFDDGTFIHKRGL